MKRSIRLTRIVSACIVAIFALISITAAVSPDKARASSSLVGYWKFDESSGTSAADSSGNSNTATLTNGATFSTQHATTSFANTGSVALDGDNEYVSVPNSSTLNMSSKLTAIAWVYWAGPNIDNTDGVVFDKSDNDTPNYRLIVKTDGQLVLWNGTQAFGSTSNIPQNQWSLINFTVGGGKVRFYINGSQVGESDGGLGPVTTNPLLIGKDSLGRFFNGKIDDARLYNTILSPQDVADIAAGEPGPGAAAPVAFDGGDGQTDETAYLISTCEQLESIGYSAENLAAHYRIHTSDIDCSDSINWHNDHGFSPIGNAQAPFTGVLDGAGFAINHLAMNRADNSYGRGPYDQEYVGLFGKTDSATVRHLALNSAKVKGWQYVGGIVGYAAGSVISDVSVNATNEPNDCDPTGNEGVCVWARFGTYGGGIVGYSDASTLTDVTVGANVKGSGQVIGGIAGYIYNTSIDGAVSHAHVDGGQNIGGLVGDGEAGDISHSSFDGTVDVVEEDHKSGNIGGGIAGSFTDGSITYTTSSGTVSGNALVGGLIGYSQSTGVANSSTTSSVTAYNDQAGGAFGSFIASLASDTTASGDVSGINYIGGFAGQSFCGSIFTDTSASGAVTASQTAGGFVGFDGCQGAGSSFTRVHASGSVTTTSDTAGGLIGYAAISTLNDSYATGDVSVNGHSGGGLVGESSQSLYAQVYSTGAVVSPAMHIGGLIGSSDHDAITDAYATGAVDAGGYAGGLIGLATASTIDKTYSSGGVAGSLYIGGLIGNTYNNDTHISNSFTVSTIEMPAGGWLATPASFVGVDHDALTYTNNYYALNSYLNPNNLTYESRPCAVHEEDYANSYPFVESGECSGVSLTDHPRMFKRSTDQPLTAWNFTVTWKTGTAINRGYPCFAWQSDCMGTSGRNSAAFVSPLTNKDVRLQLSDECSFEAMFKKELDKGAPNDVAYDYPNGLVGFNANCEQPGFTTSVTQYYYDVTPGSVVLRKYNPTTQSYFTITDAQIDQTTVDGRQATRVRYEVKDGSDRDADGKVDGKITDPAGLAINVLGVPNTGLGGRL